MKKSFLILAFIGLSLGLMQAQEVTKTVSVVPGGLYKTLTLPERQTITHLTLTGSLDARDFKTMRDAMQSLQFVDLSRVTIVAFSGTGGTENSSAKYAANTIPQNAFFNDNNGSGKRTIVEVIFPARIEGIGEKAFYACYNYERVTIPASVTSIGTEAFSQCKKLLQITVENPKPISKLGKGVFFGIDTSASTLFVPKGSKDAYAAAKQWQDFLNIEDIQDSNAAAEPTDSDGDGVADDTDKCNDTPAAAIGKIDEFGCPLDSDADGVPDYMDNCPTTAGVAANGGCPEVKAAVKQIFEKALTGIEFETGKDVIKETSNSILDEIANVMNENPTYTLLINGHTDNVGAPEANLLLSEKRANAVKFYLFNKGIPTNRMIAQGLGDTKPIADNATDAGRAKNRRVEFVVKFEE